MLNSSQKIVLKKIREQVAAGLPPRLIILKARQVGISTLIEAILIWASITRSDQSALVIAHVQKTTKALFRMSRNFHRNLTGEMKQETRLQSVHEIEFDNGSRLQVEVQGEGRGYTAQRVHLAELAFFQDAKDTLTAVMQTVPNDVDASLVVLESTGNGVGGVGQVFYNAWVWAIGQAQAVEIEDYEKGFVPVFIPWFQHEEYEIPIPVKYKGHEPYFHRTAAEEKLCRDHPEITNAKLKWRRWCIANNLLGDEEKFAQEYPATWEEAFLLSGRPAFDREAVKHYSDKLQELIQSGKMPETSEIECDHPGVGKVNIIATERGRLRIFREPQDRCTYIVGGDPSEGDPGSDPSPLAVLNQQTMDCDATWYGKAPPDVLAQYAIDLARYYNDAEIIHEANNHGILFGDTVNQIGYPNLYYRQTSVESVAQEITNKPGYMNSERTRQHLFDTLRKYVRMRMGKILCPHMVQQIQTAVYIDDKVQAGVGSQKDLLIAFGLCLMAHRGDMRTELAPLPENVIRAVAAHTEALKERYGADEAEKYALVETGMTCDEVLNRMDSIRAKEGRDKKFGIGGMR